MSLLLMLAVSVAVGAGVWLLLARDVLRVVIGLAVLGSAVNLLVFFSARPGSLIPPVIVSPAEQLAAQAANPLPQALVLTAIVIGFALLCFALLLAARLSQDPGAADVRAHHASEPPPSEDSPSPLKPDILRDA